jgi:DnaK suppressor protein
MTKIELTQFRYSLETLKADLQKNGNSGRETLDIDASADELDRIQQAQQRDLAIGFLDRNAKLLRQVRAALSRMDTGTFGICLDCEEQISVKRLAAVPWTALCIICQEAADSLVGQPWSEVEDDLVIAA